MQTLANNQKWFAVWNDEINGRLDVGYYIEKNSIAINTLHPLVALGELLARPPQYGANERAAQMSGKDDVRFIRITDITTDGRLKPDSAVTCDSPNDRYLLNDGDLLFARSGSVGRTFLYKRSYGKAIFAGYLIRFVFDPSKVLSEYVFIYTQTESYRKWVSKIARPSVQANINAQEFKSLVIPLPSLAAQEEIIKKYHKIIANEIDNAESTDKLVNDYLAKELDIIIPEKTEANKWFTVWSDELDGIISPAFATKNVLQNVPTLRLSEVASINSHIRERGIKDAILVPYVGLPQASNKKIDDVVLRPYKEVKGRQVAKEGDILFARIEPSIFNKKYILVDSLRGHDYVFVSTEFIVISPLKVSGKYLFNLLFNDFVYRQFAGRTTGSTGRRRLDKNTLMGVRVPIVPSEHQQRIVTEIERIENVAKEARQQREKQKQQILVEIDKLIFG